MRLSPQWPECRNYVYLLSALNYEFLSSQVSGEFSLSQDRKYPIPQSLLNSGTLLIEVVIHAVCQIIFSPFPFLDFGMISFPQSLVIEWHLMTSSDPGILCGSEEAGGGILRICYFSEFWSIRQNLETGLPLMFLR